MCQWLKQSRQETPCLMMRADNDIHSENRQFWMNVPLFKMKATCISEYDKSSPSHIQFIHFHTYSLREIADQGPSSVHKNLYTYLTASAAVEISWASIYFGIRIAEEELVLTFVHRQCYHLLSSHIIVDEVRVGMRMMDVNYWNISAICVLS